MAMWLSGGIDIRVWYCGREEIYGSLVSWSIFVFVLVEFTTSGKRFIDD